MVTDLGQAVRWYQSVFGLVVKEKMADDTGTYRIAVLESPESNFQLELLELKDSLPRKSLLEGKPEGTQIQGLFKYGFRVTDMDAWLRHFSDLKVQVPHVWKDDVTKKRNFIISDPDGNLIQFFE